MRDLDNHFGEYVHLKQLPREAEALTTLRKAASCVKPIMRKRGWRVGTLSEFLPEEANLWGLNINHGQQINLRLRHAGDSNQFLQFEHVLDTLLHEYVSRTARSRSPLTATQAMSYCPRSTRRGLSQAMGRIKGRVDLTTNQGLYWGGLLGQRQAGWRQKNPGG
jgi:hypothetical protein